jgi:hypothetical protein
MYGVINSELAINVHKNPIVLDYNFYILFIDSTSASYRIL